MSINAIDQRGKRENGAAKRVNARSAIRKGKANQRLRWGNNLFSNNWGANVFSNMAISPEKKEWDKTDFGRAGKRRWAVVNLLWRAPDTAY
jgi:hypothetical protein